MIVGKELSYGELAISGESCGRVRDNTSSHKEDILMIDLDNWIVTKQFDTPGGTGRHMVSLEMLPLVL